MRRFAGGRTLALTLRILATLLGLLAVYAAFLLALYELGHHLDPAHWFGGAATNAVVRARFCVLVGLLVILVQFKTSQKWMLSIAGGRFVKSDEALGLQAMVERLASLAQIPVPRVGVARSSVPNSFTIVARYGRQRTAVVVTQGLLDRLDPPEVEAVLAHEMSHLVNRDAAVMSFLAPLVLFAGGLHHSKRPDKRLLFALIACFYLPALLLFRALSRYREYSADRGAALLTGAPEQLMSALTKLEGDHARIAISDVRAIARFDALCIVPAFVRTGLLADHPPTEKRLEALAQVARELGKAGKPHTLKA